MTGPNAIHTAQLFPTGSISHSSCIGCFLNIKITTNSLISGWNALHGPEVSFFILCFISCVTVLHGSSISDCKRLRLRQRQYGTLNDIGPRLRRSRRTDVRESTRSLTAKTTPSETHHERSCRVIVFSQSSCVQYCSMHHRNSCICTRTLPQNQ